MAQGKNKILVVLCDKDVELKRWIGDSKSIANKFAEEIGGTIQKFTITHPKSNYTYNKTIPAMNRLAAELGLTLRLRKIRRSYNRDTPANFTQQ